MQRSKFSIRPGGRSAVLGAAAVSAVLLVPAAASAATVSGSVYNDFNTNGTRDAAAAGGAIDPGVENLTVRAYDASGALVDTAITSATGAYQLTNVPNARVRVELTVPSGYQPTRQLGTLRSDERFVDASTAQPNTNFGVHRPGEYSVDNPDVLFPNQYAGPTRGNRAQPVIKGVPFFGTTGYESRFATTAGRRTLATFGDVGTVFGLGQDQRTGNLFAGAFYKRFAGLTGAGPGAIFRVTPAGTVSTWATLAAGTDGHPTSTAVNAWYTNGAGKDNSWNLVGSTGLGSVKVDTAGRNLYTVNLATKRLVRLSADGTAPGAVPSGAGTAIPDPGCVQTVGTPAGTDWRPFSVGINPADGGVYVGGVCTAGTTQNPANLRVVVYRVSDPAGTPTFGTPVVSAALDHNRLNTAPSTRPNTNNSNWKPWPTAASIPAGQTPASNTRGALSRESYPQLSSIQFDGDGAIQLGLRDLMGDMSGADVPDEASPSAITQGELLRACRTGNTGPYALETGGACGGRTGAPAAAFTGYGAIGPGGRYFYDARTGYSAAGSDLDEPLGYQGGALQVPGFREVVSTGIDTGREVNSDGVLWQSNQDGGDQRGLINRSIVATTLSEDGSFGKANGLGDLAAFTREAPLQIGNRVWLDENRNGVQDAAEPPLAGVRVELIDAACAPTGSPTTTTTDANGEYVFTINPIAAGSSCQVRILLDQPPLAGLTPTSVGTGGNGRIDSDGVPTGAYVVASVGPHAVGENDHSFDFGFVQVPTTPPPPSNPPPTTPPTTPPPTTPPTTPPPPTPPPTGTNPGSGSRTHSLSIRKLANRTTVRPGQQIKYRLRVFSARSGTSDAVNERLCDVLPSNLTLVSRGGGTLRNGRLCWTIRRLKPGQSLTRTFTVRVDRDTKPGRVVNRATVTDLGRNRTSSRTVRVLKRKVPKADSNYVTG